MCLSCFLLSGDSFDIEFIQDADADARIYVEVKTSKASECVHFMLTDSFLFMHVLKTFKELMFKL